MLVGGASGGIGRATALMLAARGDHLVLTARGAGRLEQIATECSGAGAASVQVLPADVTDRQAVEGVLDAVVERFGRVDGIVHTAGVAGYGRFVDVPPEIFERVLITNVNGTANVARAAMRRFAEQKEGGHLVLVGSLLGKIATPFMSPYVTSKWAVHGLVRVLQIEARTMPGVEISLVSPGGVDTPIYRWSATFLGRQGQPPPPVDPPEKVARAVVAALGKSHREMSVGVANPAGGARLPDVSGTVRRHGHPADEDVRLGAGACRRQPRQPVRVAAPARHGVRRPQRRADPARESRDQHRRSPGVASRSACQRPEGLGLIARRTRPAHHDPRDDGAGREP